MARRLILVVLLSAAGLAGCDPTYGVGRYATVARLPAPAQVLAAVRSAPGVDSVVDVIARDPWLRPVGDTATKIGLEYRGRGGVSGFVQFYRGGGRCNTATVSGAWVSARRRARWTPPTP